jgi:hypothetical protein
MRQFLLTLGDKQSKTVVFDVLSTSIANRWADEIAKDYPLYEQDRFKGWPESPRTEAYYYYQLKEQVSIVNNYRANLIPSILHMFTQDTLNILHKHFEDLRGSIDAGTEFYNNAPDHVKSAVDKFNVLIHELEHYMRHFGYPELVGTYKDRPRIELLPEDYKQFTFKWKFGYVYINYCEVGKPLLDVFKDNDHLVGHDNIRPLTYYSADFTIKFGPDTTEEVYQTRLTQFNEWYAKQNFNFDQLSLGMIPVAKLNLKDSNLLGISSDGIISLLSQYQNIKSTCLK